MLILHLSDLHFGAHSRFKGEDLTKLGKAFFKDLGAARGTFAKGSRIDLVAVSGDIAESGSQSWQANWGLTVGGLSRNHDVPGL
ncbi:MAG TPA: hypothetical protein VF173_18975 [Thermoanaerobaculia bacterium]|nr:hypothetical protein [Thermoanaerobaculia bacterium]